MLGHALALTPDRLLGSTGCAGQPPGSYPGATPCGANDPLVVPEYQPDVHRLRHIVLGLGPTNPERTSLPQETLGFRRVGFSPTSRY